MGINFFFYNGYDFDEVINEMKELDLFSKLSKFQGDKKFKLKIGSKIITSHGLSEGGHSHEANPLVITGILEETKTARSLSLFHCLMLS